MANETIFTMDSSSIKFGPGATREVGEDMRALGTRRVVVVTDPRIANLEPVKPTQTWSSAGPKSLRHLSPMKKGK